MRNERKQAHRSLSEKVAAKAANRQSGRNRSSYLLLPDGVETFKPKKEGNYRFNIVPYVAGRNNRDTPAGELDYEFTFFVHKIGEKDDQRTIVCPKKTYGRPCPICEQVERLSKDYVENEDEIKSLKAKQRQLFNIVDARDEENRIQVYETSYFKSFGEMLDKRLRNFDDDDDENYGDFADIPGGRTLKVMFAEDTFNGNKFFAPSSIDFVPRKEELPDSIIDEAVCLDSCLKVLSYEDILKLIAGTDDEDMTPVQPVAEKRRPQRGTVQTKNDDDDEDEEPVKPVKKSKKSAPEPEEDEDDEEEEVQKPSKSKGSRKPVQEDQDDNDDDASDEEEAEEEEREIRKPSRKPAKKAEPEDEDDDDDDEDEEPVKPVKKSKKSAPEPEEDEDDEEEEKPRKSEKDKKPAKKAGKCPHGYVWGADCYVYSECDDCELCDECDAAQEDK